MNLSECDFCQGGNIDNCPYCRGKGSYFSTGIFKEGHAEPVRVGSHGHHANEQDFDAQFVEDTGKCGVCLEHEAEYWGTCRSCYIDSIID